MAISHRHLQLRDGTAIHTEHHMATDPIANLVFIHGYTEHIGRYTWMIHVLNQAGINVYLYDLRGFGQSEGERAYISHFDVYVADLIEYLQAISLSAHPSFLMGHSMGSLIAATYLSTNTSHPFHGYISSAGALKIDEGISPFLRKISGILSKIAPHLPTIKLDTNALSKDRSEVEAYIADPMVYHGGAKARLGYEMLEAMKKIKLLFSKISTPVLILHGTSDKLADPTGSQWMYDGISSDDKKVVWLDGLYHEIMREPEKEMVMNHIITWIKERSKK